MVITSLVIVTALSGSDGMMLYVISSIKLFCLTINQCMKREQSARSGQSRNRPGDIFHSDFSNGCSLYFDISACNPLTPGNITSFTAEALEDAKHFSEVEGQVQSSYPCRSLTLYRAWPPFAKKVIKQIASKLDHI